MFLFGPTGVGKTALLKRLFSTNYSVINADSKQIYRHLNIGSAKPSNELMAQIPHYLIDIKEPYE
ncbi:MAG: isopentenyl transferase family protein, partial [Sphaerochaetaceae bacterium]